jgi:hypothetical protein
MLAIGLTDQSEFAFLFTIFMQAFCLAIMIAVEIVVSGIRQRKFWAWIAGLCVFAIYVPSLFLPLGALGLWGLLDEGSRLEFSVGGNKPAAADAVTRTP